MNYGTFDYIGLSYIKQVKLAKAVIWQTNELSLPLPVMDVIKRAGIEKIVFIDHSKGQRWEFPTDKVQRYGKEKSMGQEPQWYFSTDLANKRQMKPIGYR